MAEGDGELKKDLDLVDAIATNAGTVIGSGIFAVPATIAIGITSPLLIFAVFLAAGGLSILGGLTYAELAAAVPKSGGLYAWLKETMGDEIGFLYAWTNLAVAQTAGIAAVAIFVSESIFRAMHPYDPFLAKMLATNLVVILAFVNYVGVKHGGTVQSAAFFGKTLGILGFVAVAFLLVAPGDAGLFNAPLADIPQGFDLFLAFGPAMIASLWAYDGWFQVTMVAEEVQDPGENLPKSVVIGLGIVIAVYLVFVAALLWVLGPDLLHQIGISNPDPVPAANAMAIIAGGVGVAFLAVVMAISGIGTNNAQVMTAPRLTFAMARDGLFLDPLKKIHESFGTPHRAIVLITGLAIVYTWIGTFNQLITWSIFTLWFFYAAGGISLFIYRRDRPEMDRPYTVPGYPVVPIVFIGAASFMLIAQILGDVTNSIIGAAIVLSGLPLYYAWQWMKREDEGSLAQVELEEI